VTHDNGGDEVEEIIKLELRSQLDAMRQRNAELTGAMCLILERTLEFEQAGKFAEGLIEVEHLATLALDRQGWRRR
jgi:hypothetical protein